MRRWRSRSVLVATAAILLGLAVMVMRPSSSGTATLEAAVRFEVRLAETEPANGLTEARIAPGRVIYLHPDPVVTNDDIADARVVQRSDAPELYDIALTLTGSGGEKMRKATAGHIGLPMAILIDGEVVMAPTVRSEISNQARITGRYSRADAERIANGMRLR